MHIYYTFITPMYLFILPDPFIAIICMEYFIKPILYIAASVVDHLQCVRFGSLPSTFTNHHPLVVSVSQQCELYE
jgi:hypothetical protein